ncbi:MAG TPA: DUF2461 domain-containing protein [Rhodanobacteraceae bacterium]
MERTYFSPATFRFLRQLDRHNNREWFQSHKADYEQHVREPFLALIADLAEPLAKISPHYRADARKVGGSMFRIQRDTRFSNNKQPYKPFAGARLFHERRREIAAPSFYLHIAPDDCFAGGGLWHPEAHTLLNIRRFMVDNPAAWKKATRGRAFREHFEFWGESLQRPPRGFDADHELADDLKRKSFAAGEGFDEALACSSELRPYAVATFKRIAPMIDYLCAAQDLAF